jgi:hypothetical protein
MFSCNSISPLNRPAAGLYQRPPSQNCTGLQSERRRFANSWRIELRWMKQMIIAAISVMMVNSHIA